MPLIIARRLSLIFLAMGFLDADDETMEFCLGPLQNDTPLVPEE